MSVPGAGAVNTATVAMDSAFTRYLETLPLALERTLQSGLDRSGGERGQVSKLADQTWFGEAVESCLSVSFASANCKL
jgi:hypothetical protein